jgi:hypothetical protein
MQHHVESETCASWPRGSLLRALRQHVATWVAALRASHRARRHQRVIDDLAPHLQFDSGHTGMIRDGDSRDDRRRASARAFAMQLLRNP